MNASCYLCDKGCAAIPNHRATGDALGVCQNCSILACDGHAQRDPNSPRFICVLCETALLTAAGVSKSDLIPSSDRDSISKRWRLSNALREQGARYDNLEDFTENRPEYAWILNSVDQVCERAERRFIANLSETFWALLSHEGRRFVAAAIVLVEEVKIPAEELVEILKILVLDWRSPMETEA